MQSPGLPTGGYIGISGDISIIIVFVSGAKAVAGILGNGLVAVIVVVNNIVSKINAEAVIQME